MAFQFEKPMGFDFKTGQSVDLTLMNPPETDSEGNTRTFSIASAPFENQLVFATRMRDTAFKRSLRNIALGTAVKIDSAMGSFTLHKNAAKPAVLLAGGIGITPFFSIVRQADHDHAPHKLHLFCSRALRSSAFARAWARRTKFGTISTPVTLIPSRAAHSAS
jgi:ferredoxin-NADP reductase